ncbi:MAG: radical SAM protein, partial [Chitinivibrionales bacterium]
MNCEASYKIMANPAGPVCNLECTYCYYLEKKELYSESESFNMSEGVLEQYVKDYIGSVQGDEVEFLWQGGEPTLRGIGFFEKAIEYQSRYSKGKGILNTLQTNGTLLNKEWVKFLRNNSFLVGVSIDGPEHIHNRYRRYRDGSGT